MKYRSHYFVAFTSNATCQIDKKGAKTVWTYRMVKEGDANVNLKMHSLQGKISREIPDSWIPNRARVVAQLGVPTEELASKNMTLMIYRYEVLQPPPITQKIHTYIQLTCRNKDQKIISFVSNVFGPEIGVGLF